MLGVFGDSFSNTPASGYNGYQDFVANLLKIKLHNHSLPGSSVWWSYCQFLENYKQYSHIIFSYTYPHRWLSLPEHLKHCAWMVTEHYIKIDGNTEHLLKEEMRNLIKVHKYFFDEKLNLFVYQNIFDSVNKICFENNIKLFNVMPFESSKYTLHKMMLNDNSFKDFGPQMIDTTNHKGSCLLSLANLSILEHNHIEKNTIYKKYVEELDIRGSHLNISNNKLIADIIYDHFMNNRNEILDILDNPAICVDPQEIKNMVDNFLNS